MIDQFATVDLRIIKKQPQMATTAHISGLLTQLGLSDSAQEELWVVALDGSRNVRTVVCAAKGGYHDCDVSMPTIMSAVLLAGTDRFFVAHNHPAGDLEPTNHDFDLTWRLADAAEMMDMIFEDHVIVGPGGDWYSLRGHKQMRPARGAARVATR